jgi:hypothetical protein
LDLRQYTDDSPRRKHVDGLPIRSPETLTRCRAGPPMNTGKVVILGMLAVTLGLASFAVWYRQHAGRRTRELWGIEHARRIQLASQADLLRLPAPAERIESPGADAAWKAIGKVSGITHVRGALLEDRSFDWGPPQDCPAAWQYVLRFRDDDGSTQLALDLTCARIRLLEGEGTEVSFAPMATFLRRFVTSQFPPASGP